MSERCAEKVWDYQGSTFGHERRCERNAAIGDLCSQHAEKRNVEGATTTWYQANVFSEYQAKITPVEVLKETADTLLLKDGDCANRVKKSDKWNRYFATRKEAIEFYRSRVRAVRAKADALEQTVNGLAFD